METLTKYVGIGSSSRSRFRIAQLLPVSRRKICGGIEFLRQLVLVVALVEVFALVTPGAAQSLPSGQNVDAQPQNDSDAYTTTVAYVEQFYPLWFTYGQFQHGDPLGATNAFVAAKQITPLYHLVVAINNDTLYTSIYFDLRAEPLIVTIPATALRYTTLTLDPYGTAIEPGLPAAPGVYAFTGPEFSGVLAQGITQIPMPIDFPSLYIRTVKYSQTGENLIDQGIAFQKSLLAQPLSEYLNNPLGGATKFLPETDFALSFKLRAERLIARNPIAFLKQLQQAVAAPNTPPLSADEEELSNHFDELFGQRGSQQSDFRAGARAAHAAIVSNYLTNTGPTNWIHFTNISNWGDDVLDRSSITEYLQLANGIGTAAYYHTFSDNSGGALTGSNARGYVLTFPAGELPDAALFWSLTAYTPDAIELIPNLARKYGTASYLDLQDNPDGSLSIYMSAVKPRGVPTANWLPVLPGPFNIMLRIYGPQGDVVDNTYVPPGIQKR